MARNAQNVFPGVAKTNPYEPQVNQPTAAVGVGTSATSPSYNDPIQASAAQWAAQSTTTTATFEPPPAYSFNAPSNHIPTSPSRGIGWDQSFLNEGGQNPAAVHSANANSGAKSDPSNPFH